MRSMTGYGSANAENISIEVKSINHRFFEFCFHCPCGYSFLEEHVRNLAKKFISRGKVDISLRIDETYDNDMEIKLNLDLASKYVNALNALSCGFELQNNTSAFQLLTLPGMIKLEKPEIDEDAVLQKALECTKTALNNLKLMRETEGQKLQSDIKDKLGSIISILAEIKNNSLASVLKYQTRLEQNIKALLKQNDIQSSEQRILTEVAIFADKVSIDEEIVRLESHINQMDKLILFDGSIGKKMDFLVQEMNRETNTIGSKCTDSQISQSVIEIKAILEKIREQVQNIE